MFAFQKLRVTRTEFGTRFLVYAKLTDREGGGQFLHTNHAWDYEVLGLPDE